MTSTPLGPNGYVADGIHQEMHWFVQRTTAGTLLITISGYVGDHLAFRQEEWTSATTRKVMQLAEAEIAAVQARQAKQHARRKEAVG